MRVTRVVREEIVMSDWLSETEDFIETHQFSLPIKARTERMARVIRELAKVVAHLEADEHDGTVYFSSDKVAEALWALSPDAKELLK